MSPLNPFFKPLLPLLFVIAISFTVGAQTLTEINSWNGFVLHKIKQVNIAPPPDAAATLNEIKEIKILQSAYNSSIQQQVRYWNAGAPAYRWNEIANQLTAIEFFTKKNGGNIWRGPIAWMNVAIYDATIAAWQMKYRYNRKRPFQKDKSVKHINHVSQAPSYPCEHAVTAGAAATVLGYFYPELKDSIIKMGKEAANSKIYSGLQYPSDVTEGWKLGEAVALLIIDRVKKDGSHIPWQGTVPHNAGQWSGDNPVGVMVGKYTPIVLHSGSQFRPAPPPDFAAEMKEIKSFQRNFQSNLLAYTWASRTGLDAWTDQANRCIFENNLQDNAAACARIYTLLHVAVQDALIACWDAKYTYWGIRPFQYDTTFQPLIFTPPFPGYPSGHASIAGAASTVLTHFFPANEAAFKAKAQECADSRFYAGIHFKTDNRVGLALGISVARYIINHSEKNNE